MKNLISSYTTEITKIVKNIKKKNKYILHEPSFDNDDIFQINKCINSTYVSTVSKYVNTFEKNLCKYVKSKYAVATNTGTAAMEIALQCIGIKKNDEVLIPDLNYIASANCTLRIGAIPHFIDINSNNLGPDVDQLILYLKKISYLKNGKLINKKTKRIIRAIIPTHIFGNSCDIQKIIQIAKNFKLKVIEDSSEALGSFYKGKHLGTLGDIGVISFNGNKIITTGGGGALITNNKKIYDKALHSSKISRKKKYFWEYDYDELGYNYRMSGVNAALGISQLKKINKLLIKKKKLNNFYNKSFLKNKNIEVVNQNTNSKWNFWLNNIIIKNINIKKRNKIIILLNKKKIFVRPIWKLMHKIKYLNKYPRMKIKNSLIIEKGLISLPSSSNLIK